MHPAMDESAAFAFGRFVSIRIQPPASSSPAQQFITGYLQTYINHFTHHSWQNVAQLRKNEDAFLMRIRAAVNVAFCLQLRQSHLRGLLKGHFL